MELCGIDIVIQIKIYDYRNYISDMTLSGVIVWEPRLNKIARFTRDNSLRLEY